MADPFTRQFLRNLRVGLPYTVPPPPPPITVNVQAVEDRVVYDINGFPIPNDRYVATPLSPTVVLALKYGDLVEAEAEVESQSPTQQQSTAYRYTPPAE